jgi:molecular chaperone GrpE
MHSKKDKEDHGKDKAAPAAVELEQLREKARKADEYYDRMLRAQAELENTKKRLTKEKDEFMKFANEDLIMRLLPIVDNFDRALASVKHTKESDAILQGIRMVQKELHSLFRDHGVEVIKSVGERFDPHLHEAIAVVESQDHPEDTVVEEIQTGYTLRGRLIRPSIVKVSKRKQ